MRCDEIIQELSRPEGCRDEQAVERHLAECGRCAQWADRAARLDRLWDVTRPAEPSPEAWDQVWAAVSTRLDSASAAPRTAMPASRVPASARPWRGLAVVAAIGFAQAAAVFLAMSVSWTGPAGSPSQVASSHQRQPESVVEAVVDVPEGQVVYLRSTGNDLKVIDVTALEPANGEDPWFVFFNRVESASTMIAMSE